MKKPEQWAKEMSEAITTQFQRESDYEWRNRVASSLVRFAKAIQADAAKSAVASCLDEALNSGDGTYKP